jgi:hypothetical protein
VNTKCPRMDSVLDRGMGLGGGECDRFMDSIAWANRRLEVVVRRRERSSVAT